MMGFICAFLFAWDGEVFQDGPWRVVHGQDSFCVLRLDLPAFTPRHNTGRVVAINQNGIVYHRGSQWFFWRLDHPQAHALSPPNQTYLKSPLARIKGPAFLSQTQLFRWINQAWQPFPLDVFVELKTPKLVPGSQHGLKLIFPQIFQTADGQWVTYQPKVGTLRQWQWDDSQPQKSQFGKHRRALAIGDRLAWAGAPGKTSLALTVKGKVTHFASQITLPNLNKHSLIIARDRGCWILTFPSGLRDGLKSWDSGTLPIKAHYLKIMNEGELRVDRFPLSKLPLDFDLTTSASGSPRLEVNPLFRVLPVYQSESIAVLTEEKLYLVRPGSGVSTHAWDKENADAVSLVRVDANLGGYDSAGHWQLFLEGLY